MSDFIPSQIKDAVLKQALLCILRKSKGTPDRTARNVGELLALSREDPIDIPSLLSHLNSETPERTAQWIIDRLRVSSPGE